MGRYTYTTQGEMPVRLTKKALANRHVGLARAMFGAREGLLEQHHFSRLYDTVGFESIEVHAAGEHTAAVITPIELHVVLAGDRKSVV